MLSRKNLCLGTVAIALLMLILILLPRQDALLIKTLRIIFWSVYVLFLPWYWLTLSFFDAKEIDILERFALSFALSISIVPLLTFYINLIGVKITQVSIRWVVVVVIAACIGYLFRKAKTFWKAKSSWTKWRIL